MGEQTVEWVLPTGPGWWWVRVYDAPACIAEVWSTPGGLMTLIPGDDDPSHLDDSSLTWLAPVAPIGSVPPEVYARDVHAAYSLGITTCAAALHVPESRLNGARGTWPYSAAAKGATRTLTIHGLNPDEAARIVREVAS